jgi:hypothetical protein
MLPSVVEWCVTKKISIQLNPEELKALVTLADNQMFRMKFIDPKIPGYKMTPEVFRAAQSALGLLHEASVKEGFERQAVKVASGGGS